MAPLEESLMRARDDVLARPEFYRLLMTEYLFIAGDCGRPSGDDSAVEARPGDRLNIAVVQFNGRRYHPVFTSLDRLNGFHKSPSFAMRGRDLFNCTRGAEFVLNPGTEHGKKLTTAEIAFWLDPSARARRDLQKNPPQVKFRLPQPEPKTLLDALRVLFKARVDVQAAYVLDVAFSDRNEPPHPLIGIETKGDWPKIFSETSEIIGAIVPNVIVDVVPLDRNDANDLLSSALLKTEPFYRRAENLN
ncbi:MAG TPA: enhanced serine sensitivity protein SseB C-terminal domain-containing protein [Rhizomicrobium sp.]|nr:enhanced serine sensitivity protein SseB C-terminal domain-containing protein [Rhizomicrobium sp.]